MQKKEAIKKDKSDKVIVIAIIVAAVLVLTFGTLIILERTGVIYPDVTDKGEITAPKVEYDTPRSEGAFDYMILEDGTAMIVGWDSGDAEAVDLVTPTELGGYKITAIAGRVFAMHSEIKSITFSDGITYIGEEALYGALCTVSLPASLEAIDDGAFAGVASEGITFRGTRAQWATVRIGKNNPAVLKVNYLE